MLGAGLVLQAIGMGLFPLVRSPWEAFVLIAIEGAGSAGFWPSQSTLIAHLTPPDRRHAAYAQQRVTMNLGIGLGGLVGGLIASGSSAQSFTVLFVVDAATFLAYVVVLAFIHDDAPHDQHVDAQQASYRAVLRDRVFIGLWTLNFLFVTAGYSLFNLVPPFAHDQAGLNEHQIGALFFINTIVIVIAQLPISRAIEGRRRMRALALMPMLWIVSWLLLDLAGWRLDGTAAFALMAVALAIFGIGECFHGPAHQALVAEIGPGSPPGPVLRGALALVGARRNDRACDRRLRARGGAVRALAARRWRVRDRRGRRAATRAAHPEWARAHPPRRPGASRACARWDELTVGNASTITNMPPMPIIEDPLSTDAEPASHPAVTNPRNGRHASRGDFAAR